MPRQRKTIDTDLHELERAYNTADAICERWEMNFRYVDKTLATCEHDIRLISSIRRSILHMLDVAARLPGPAGRLAERLSSAPVLRNLVVAISADLGSVYKEGLRAALTSPDVLTSSLRAAFQAYVETSACESTVMASPEMRACGVIMTNVPRIFVRYSETFHAQAVATLGVYVESGWMEHDLRVLPETIANADERRAVKAFRAMYKNIAAKKHEKVTPLEVFVTVQRLLLHRCVHVKIDTRHQDEGSRVHTTELAAPFPGGGELYTTDETYVEVSSSLFVDVLMRSAFEPTTWYMATSSGQASPKYVANVPAVSVGAVRASMSTGVAPFAQGDKLVSMFYSPRMVTTEVLDVLSKARKPSKKDVGTLNALSCAGQIAAAFTPQDLIFGTDHRVFGSTSAMAGNPRSAPLALKRGVRTIIASVYFLNEALETWIVDESAAAVAELLHTALSTVSSICVWSDDKVVGQLMGLRSTMEKMAERLYEQIEKEQRITKWIEGLYRALKLEVMLLSNENIVELRGYRQYKTPEKDRIKEHANMIKAYAAIAPTVEAYVAEQTVHAGFFMRGVFQKASPGLIRAMMELPGMAVAVLENEDGCAEYMGQSGDHWRKPVLEIPWALQDEWLNAQRQKADWPASLVPETMNGR